MQNRGKSAFSSENAKLVVRQMIIQNMADMEDRYSPHDLIGADPRLRHDRKFKGKVTAGPFLL